MIKVKRIRFKYFSKDSNFGAERQMITDCTSEKDVALFDDKLSLREVRAGNGIACCLDVHGLGVFQSSTLRLFICTTGGLST